MSFADFPEQKKVTELLQRSLERNRLAHAYLFTGNSLDELEAVARTLAKALNCQGGEARNAQAELGTAEASPLSSQKAHFRSDCCDHCDSCQRIDAMNHPDVLVVRPESKTRIITIDQMRELMQTVNLKPTIAEFKVGIIVCADRLNVQAANAFLKTLEEPPSKCVLILLTTEPQRILETIISRCLRLNFAGQGVHFSPEHVAWLGAFSEMAAKPQGGLLARYRLLGVLLQKLADQKAEIEKHLAARSPLERYDEIESDLREKLEKELAAAVEAEYRRQRADLLSALQWWLRDVWLETLAAGNEMIVFPNLIGAAKAVSQRISRSDALENLQVLDRLQRQLHSNVQEALALEVGLLKLKL